MLSTRRLGDEARRTEVHPIAATPDSSISDYGLIGDTRSAALVHRDGTIEWLCWPDFDSPACLSSLVGGLDNGCWTLAPTGDVVATSRSYLGESLVLETVHRTPGGEIRVIDLMPVGTETRHLIRLVRGISGLVEVGMQLRLRGDYGQIVPWVTRDGDGIVAIAGPDAFRLSSEVPTRGAGLSTVATFTVDAGDEVVFVLEWFPSFEEPGAPIDARAEIGRTSAWWSDWAERSCFTGPLREATVRSLLTLKALTFGPTGAVVAAPTTSLPEEIGGQRNWDYRYCWLRDATFALYALVLAGHGEEARSWSGWLNRAVAGDPESLQIMYGIRGERRLPETEATWLDGFAGSQPVRIGNAAAAQFQLDVFGEIMDAFHVARRHGLGGDDASWDLQRMLVDHVEAHWTEPDDGIWEIRGAPRHFVHSKVMAWVAVDRAVRASEEHRLPGPLARWRELRTRIHDDVCRRGFNHDVGAFTQHYDTEALDAAVLMIPLVGFLPPDDARMRSTVDAVGTTLIVDGLVRRYQLDSATTGIDGLSGTEGVFLACSLWLADNLAMQGRRVEALALFDRVVRTGNDLGLFSEEYDTTTGQLLGNFPQAFTHIAVVNTAWNLFHASGPRHPRAVGEST